MICLRSMVYPRGPGVKIVIPPNHHMMAERLCAWDGHPETGTDALCLVLCRSQSRQYNRHAIGFRPGIGRASTGYRGGGLPGIECPVLPPAIHTPWMSSASERCRSKRDSVSRNDGW